MNNYLASNIKDSFNPPPATVSVGSLVSVIAGNAIKISGVVFVILVLYAGIMLIAGAGSGDAQQMANGKKALTIAVVGFVIIFTAYWILRILGVLTIGVTNIF